MIFAPLLWSILLSVTLCAHESTIAAKIIDKAVVSLFDGRIINAWGETDEQKEIIRQSSKMEPVNDPRNAHFLIIAGKIPSGLSTQNILFTTEYELLAKDERFIGAFFWQKGRPNLLFLRSRLQKANLSLGHEFDKYIEDEL